MSSLDFEREVAEINEKSTIPEVIGLLISSFRRKEFKLVEDILMKREDDLRTQLQEEQQKRSLLEKIHCDSELEILEVKEDLKRLQNENFELQEELKRLKREKVETAQKFLEYGGRMTNLEKAMANAFSVDVSEIHALACGSSENDLQKEGSNDGTSKIRKELQNGHGNAQVGIEDAHDTPKVGIDGLMHENKNDNSYAAGSNDGTSKTRKELQNGHVNAQVGIEDAHDTPKVGIDGLMRENKNDNSYAAASKSNKTCDRPRSPMIVEIIESDDEPIDEKPNVCPTQGLSKRNVRSNPLDNFLTKRKRSLGETDDSQVLKARCQRLKAASRKLDFHSSDDSSDYSSSDSEDECTDSVINKMIESLRQDYRKSQKTWNFGTDMLSEFLTDNELCMNAVCALYRKKISTKKSINYASNPINLDLFNSMGVKDIAEYLIDGDPEYKLKRTVSEVRQKDSTLLHRCKEVAVKYHETLFEIYRKNEDPFFPPRS